MSAHDSVLPESPRALARQDGESSKQTCMSRESGKDGSLKKWLAGRLHQIEEKGESAFSCPLWCYRRPPHACHSSICSFLFIIMAYSLFLHGSAVHELSVAYGPQDAWKEIVIDDRLAGASLVSYELPSFMANSRHFLESRPAAFNGIMQQYSCTGATQVADATRGRGSGDADFQQLLENLASFEPCGLVSMSVFMDQFRLTDTEGAPVSIDETDLAWASDADLYSDWSVSTTLVGNETFEYVQIDADRSWIPDSTFLEHLKVWYRTPVSPYVRHLWGRIPGGLPAGRYNLTFPVNSPIFTEEWSVPEKRLIFSQTSPVSQLGSSGASYTLAALCCVVALVDFLVALVLLVAGKAPKRKSAVHPA